MYRKPIVAPKGYVYTDGKKDYGRVIYVDDYGSKISYYLITDEEYQKILEEQNQIEKMKEVSYE
jgi:hypothetical protein